MIHRYRAKITSKGQITLPRQVRDELGVREGDSVVFSVENGEIQVLPVRDSSPFSQFQGIGNPGIDDGREGINAWIRDTRGHAANSN